MITSGLTSKKNITIKLDGNFVGGGPGFKLPDMNNI